MVTLPFVLLLLDYWPLGWRPYLNLRLAAEKIPYLIFSAAASVVVFRAQRHAGAVTSLLAVSLGARLGNAAVSYARYLGKTVMPTDLAAFYPEPGHWPWWVVGGHWCW